MMDLLFFVKTFILSVALVVVMQVQVGDRSLEHHAMGWVQSSVVVQPLNGVAKGAAKLARDLTQTISSTVKKNTRKEKRLEQAASSN